MRDDNASETRTSPAGQHPAAAATRDAFPQPGQLLARRFLLLHQLGSGGSGVVFAATDTRLGQKVAVKLVHPSLSSSTTRERLRREVRAARLAHPNAVTVYELHEHDGVVFLAMELVEGQSLRSRLQSGAPLPVDEAVGIGRQVAAALAHLHGLGLVHRDVKPGNILLQDDGCTKLCDMGLVRPLEHAATLTETAMVVGTPAYMAPEQAEGGELSAASDVYSLGLTLFECLTGKIPLQGDTAVATALLRRRSPPPRRLTRSSGCPSWLARLLRRMLDPDPRERPSAAAVEGALRRQRARFRPRRRHLAAAAALLVAALAGGFAYHALAHGPTVRTEVLEREIRGVDAHGRITWHYELPLPIHQQTSSDLDGNGEDEIAVVTGTGKLPSDRVADVPSPEILVVDRRGDLLLRVEVADTITVWNDDFPKSIEAQIKAIDLDHDGATELIVAARQRNFYPTALLIYRPKAGTWDQILYHSGQIYDFDVALGEEPPRLRFLAVANRLGMVPVVGEILVSNARPPASSRSFTLQSPENRFLDVGGLRWSFYTLLDPSAVPLQRNVTPELSPTAEGGFAFHLDQMTGAVDRWGNPTPGPNAGRDLRDARRRFLQQLSQLGWLDTPSWITTPAGVRAAAGEIAASGGALLHERPYRAVLGLAVARALARAGDPADAIERLRAAVADAPWDDLIYRLANLEALSGRTAAAEARLEAAVAESRSARARFDMPVLLTRLAIKHHSPAKLQRWLSAIPVYTPRERREGVTSTVWARTHLWWDELAEPDTRMRSWAYAPAGEAIACLARWRLGRTAADDPERMRETIVRNPDARYEARIALGASLLALGRAGDALTVLQATANALEPLARDDFGFHQLHQLARSLELRALAASGQEKRAAAAAAALLPELTPGLLPANIAAEVAGPRPPSR